MSVFNNKRDLKPSFKWRLDNEAVAKTKAALLQFESSKDTAYNAA